MNRADAEPLTPVKRPREGEPDDGSEDVRSVALNFAGPGAAVAPDDDDEVDGPAAGGGGGALTPQQQQQPHTPPPLQPLASAFAHLRSMTRRGRAHPPFHVRPGDVPGCVHLLSPLRTVPTATKKPARCLWRPDLPYQQAALIILSHLGKALSHQARAQPAAAAHARAGIPQQQAAAICMDVAGWADFRRTACHAHNELCGDLGGELSEADMEHAMCLLYPPYWHMNVGGPAGVELTNGSHCLELHPDSSLLTPPGGGKCRKVHHMKHRDYLLVTVGGSLVMTAHRLVLYLVVGPPPPGADIAMHICNNPACANWLHLMWGSASENLRHWRELEEAGHDEAARAQVKTQWSLQHISYRSPATHGLAVPSAADAWPGQHAALLAAEAAADALQLLAGS